MRWRVADNHTLESLLREVRAADYCSSKLEWVAPVCELFEVLVATVRAQDERIGELERLVRGDGK